MLKWYKAENIGAIREDIVQNNLTIETLPHALLVSKYFLSNGWHGLSKDGGPVDLECTGSINPRDFLENLPSDKFLLWHKYSMEFKNMFLDNASKKHKTLVKIFSVKDLTGYQYQKEEIERDR